MKEVLHTHHGNEQAIATTVCKIPSVALFTVTALAGLRVRVRVGVEARVNDRVDLLGSGLGMSLGGRMAVQGGSMDVQV